MCYSAVPVGYVRALAGSGGSGSNGGAAVATLVQKGAGQAGALTTAHRLEHFYADWNH